MTIHSTMSSSVNVQKCLRSHSYLIFSSHHQHCHQQHRTVRMGLMIPCSLYEAFLYYGKYGMPMYAHTFIDTESNDMRMNMNTIIIISLFFTARGFSLKKLTSTKTEREYERENRIKMHTKTFSATSSSLFLKGKQP